MSLNFGGLRILVFCGTVRALLRGEWKAIRWNSLDTVVTCMAVVRAIVFITQYGSVDALKNQAGVMYDAVGMYFLFRCLVYDWLDVAFVVKGISILSVFVAISFVIERLTGRNMFSVFGGVPAITGMRGGKFRCQGAFAHPILAGCFWAVLIPLMIGLRRSSTTGRYWGSIGVSCSLLIIYFCQSSTPVSAVVGIAAGFALFPLRAQMRFVRYAALVMVLALQMVMDSPIWSLVARVDFVGGSTGWHRFNLINTFVDHFSEWYMFGVRSVEPWGVFAGDVTNQFVLEGIRGGLATLILFFWTIVLAFVYVGRVCRAQGNRRSTVLMAWSLGVALGAHCICFIGVSYFGQIIMLWYLTLAIIASMASLAGKGRSSSRGQGTIRSQANRGASFAPVPT